MLSFLAPFLFALGVVHRAWALDAAGWRNQSIYQVITDRFARTDGSSPLCDSAAGRYCNGTWAGITSKLDYIQNLGATAVWISPVNKNVEGVFGLDGEAYHGYWPDDLGALNPHFGTADDLKALSAALHARGMLLMVDISPNDMGFPRAPGDFSNLQPFNQAKYYHHKCHIRWGNEESERLCWLEGLPDLRTESEEVRAMLRTWIADLVKTYNIDGLRIDAALEIEKDFWTTGGFREAAGVFLLAEVNRNHTDELAGYQPYLDGIMDYATWEFLIRGFRTTVGGLSNLANVTDTFAAMPDVQICQWGSFVENQDNPRFPFLNTDTALDKNVIAMSMLRDAIPIIYYGQEQYYAGGNRPLNREALWLGQGYNTGDTSPLYGYIKHLNAVRRTAMDADAQFLSERTRTLFFRDPGIVEQGSAGVIAFRKGQMVTMYTNGGVTGNFSPTYSLSPSVMGYAGGAVAIDVLNCERFVAGKSGYMHVQMPSSGLPRVFLPESQAATLCPTTKDPTTVPSSQTVTIKKIGD